ncbi:MAG: hypothetical protein MSC45_03670 [Mobiluncus sp.]|uniref:PIN domain-containing protein n=2 Tax=Mobiluncus porci TaxID=2652278 RepID=A0A7K0K448_9ACTO|nr:PIN domain-containing protein [Mobiluncus sp.]MCI6584153.1 hypothetical protein [Mobiluncus sp.]MST49830.1 hypothetical protein [Mobiluncus porci]
MGRTLNLLKVADVTHREIGEAYVEHLSDFEDGVLAAAAKAANCDYIITRNTRDFKGSSVQAITPKNFLKKHFPRQ